MIKVLLIKMHGLEPDGSCKKNVIDLGLQIVAASFQSSNDARQHIEEDGWYAVLPVQFLTKNVKSNGNKKKNQSPGQDNKEGESNTAEKSREKVGDGYQGGIGGTEEGDNQDEGKAQQTGSPKSSSTEKKNQP